MIEKLIEFQTPEYEHNIERFVFDKSREKIGFCKTIWGKIMQDQQDKAISFYKPMLLSEILFQRLIVDTKMGEIIIVKDDRQIEVPKNEGGMWDYAAEKRALRINESNNNNWRFSVLSCGDYNFSDDAFNKMTVEDTIIFSMLSEAITERSNFKSNPWKNTGYDKVNDNDLKKLSETVVKNYLEFINQYKQQYYIPEDQTNKCTEEILNYIKDISNNQTVIAGVSSLGTKIVQDSDVIKFTDFKNDLLYKNKADLSSQFRVSLKEGTIDAIYEFHEKKYNNYFEVLEQVKNIRSYAQ